MKNLRIALTLILALTLAAVSLTAIPVQAQDPQTQTQTQEQVTALMRGYRAGYSDGYPTGRSDQASNAAREFRNKTEYEHGDRAYNSRYGTLEEYRDGYQQGFETGYNAGFDRKPFDSSIPDNLRRRTEDSTVQYPTDENKRPGSNSPQSQSTQSGNLNNNVPRDTIMRIELLSDLATDASQKGDHFQARVVEPKEYEGAIINGRVVNVKRPGRVKSTAQLQLSFDEIRLSDGRTARISAQVIEVIPGGGSQGAGKVDSEGGVQGTSSTKQDVEKVGAATGIGAIIGAIAGGGVGAAVGATIGAGVGTAGVLSERGKDIHLYKGQQLRIRTAGEIPIR